MSYPKTITVHPFDHDEYTEEELDDLDYFFGAGVATDTKQARATKEQQTKQ